ncbi:MAG: hypothetical protein FWE48_05645 [Coriobacteriia bacterium]|nr:hypothetical protein [Coriobacteriia bacterium]
MSEILEKLSKHYQRLRDFQQAHINTKPRIWAASILASLLLIALTVWVLFFLFGSPLEEGALSSANDEVVIQGISVPTLNAVVGDREIAELSHSLGTRSSRVSISYHQDYLLTESQALLSLYTDTYIEHLVHDEHFWLLGRSEEDSSATATLLKVIDEQRILTVQLGVATRTLDAYALPRTYVDIDIIYTLRDFGFFGMPLGRAAAFDDFLSGYELSAGELLLQYDGLRVDAVAAYIQTAGDALEEMSPEEIEEFGRSLRSFIWSLIIASLSVLSPLTVIVIARFVYSVKRNKDKLDEAMPAIRTYCAELIDRFKESKEEQHDEGS